MPYVSHGPWLHPKERERLRRFERKAARQRRSARRGRPVSGRLQRTYTHIAELRGREKRRRADWHHKVTTVLADRYALIGVEQLNVRAMTARVRGSVDRPSRAVAQKTGLNRAILGEGRSRILALLDYKAAERGGVVVRVPTGAADDDPLPGLMAGQINWVHQALMTTVTEEMIAGRKPAEVSREALVLLDDMEELLSEKVLNYAVRAAR